MNFKENNFSVPALNVDSIQFSERASESVSTVSQDTVTFISLSDLVWAHSTLGPVSLLVLSSDTGSGLLSPVDQMLGNTGINYFNNLLEGKLCRSFKVQQWSNFFPREVLGFSCICSWDIKVSKNVCNMQIRILVTSYTHPKLHRVYKWSYLSNTIET